MNYGIGFNSGGKYKTRINGKSTKAYETWKNMLTRCYNEKYHEKYSTYVNCEVCEEWLDYQVFAEWWENNYYEIGNEKMCLDKDILHKGNKIYSPSTCVFVSQDINKLFVKQQRQRGELFVGVYYNKASGKYKAQIVYKNKRIHLGLFDNEHEAFYTYKLNKQLIIYLIAEEYRDKIPSCLYNVLMSYEVNEND